MTYREKLIKDYPGLNWDRIDEITRNDCPSDYGYEDPICCSVPTYCEQCWLREIPEEEPKMNPEKKKTCRECGHKEKGYFASQPEQWVCLGVKHPFTIYDLDKECVEGYPVEQPEDILNPVESVAEVTKNLAATFGNLKTAIKDSGDRTQFESGAVRDMHAGKGRMDLLPWAAVMEVSKHCEKGAIKYGEHNVDKGIPTSSLCDSAARHLAKYLDGWTDEPHLVAAAWNLLWAIQMEVKNKEMVNTPWKKNMEESK